MGPQGPRFWRDLRAPQLKGARARHWRRLTRTSPLEEVRGDPLLEKPRASPLGLARENKTARRGPLGPRQWRGPLRWKGPATALEDPTIAWPLEEAGGALPLEKPREGPAAGGAPLGPHCWRGPQGPRWRMPAGDRYK